VVQETFAPTKALGVIAYTYEENTSSGQEQQQGLVVHYAQERDGPDSNHLRTTLLTQQWKMEYNLDGNLVLQLIDLDCNAGTVLVREDNPEKSPFIARAQADQGKGDVSTVTKQKTTMFTCIRLLIDETDGLP
jgi:hypothetical protein